MLFRVTFASVVFLLVVSVWAIVNYCQDEKDKMADLHTTMKPAYTYFDTNRGRDPITHLEITSDGTSGGAIGFTMPSCQDADHELSKIFTYNGNSAGYKDTT
jgi:hypothetical protein